MKEISVVVPVYNSAGNLKELYRQVGEALRELDYELILVNDCSTDNSWNNIKQLVFSNKDVIGINLRKNCGQDNALMAGLQQATGNYVVIMDDDLQHSPYDIPRLHKKCGEGFDICYAKFNGKKQAIWKNIGSAINGLSAWLLFNKPKGIYLSPFKIIHHEIIKEVANYSGPFPYVDGLLFQVTENVTSIEAEHHRRFKGKGNFNLFRSFSVFLRTLTSFSILPLRLATILGFSISTLGFLFALYYLVEYLFISRSVEGWTSLMVSLLIVGGIMLMFFGLIGEYLGRMFLTLNKKPQFSIKEVVKKQE